MCLFPNLAPKRLFSYRTHLYGLFLIRFQSKNSYSDEYNLMIGKRDKDDIKCTFYFLKGFGGVIDDGPTIRG